MGGPKAGSRSGPRPRRALRGAESASGAGCRPWETGGARSFAPSWMRRSATRTKVRSRLSGSASGVQSSWWVVGRAKIESSRRLPRRGEALPPIGGPRVAPRVGAAGVRCDGAPSMGSWNGPTGVAVPVLARARARCAVALARCRAGRRAARSPSCPARVVERPTKRSGGVRAWVGIGGVRRRGDALGPLRRERVGRGARGRERARSALVARAQGAAEHLIEVPVAAAERASEAPRLVGRRSRSGSASPLKTPPPCRPVYASVPSLCRRIFEGAAMKRFLAPGRLEDRGVSHAVEGFRPEVPACGLSGGHVARSRVGLPPGTSAAWAQPTSPSAEEGGGAGARGVRGGRHRAGLGRGPG